MKKNGFTLVELLAIIIILAIVFVITLPKLDMVLFSSKNDLYALMVQKMEKSGEEYVLQYRYEIEGLEDEGYGYITLEEMINKGVVEPPIINPKTGEELPNTAVVTVARLANGDYDYNFYLDISEAPAVVDNTPPVITMLGTSPITIDAGSVYSDAGATANDNIDGNITANIVATSTVNVNMVGSYTVTYNVSDSAGNEATSVVRTVNVVAVIPTVTTTNPATNITSTGATVGGEVTSAGGSTITERGIVYGISANPTINDNKVVVAGTTGSYSGNITGLTNGVIYHARAYATNSEGTNYGSDITFTTLLGGIDQYTVLMLHMDGVDNGTTFTDETGKTVTRVDNTVTKTGIKKFGTASAYFDGSGDYLSLLDSDDWYFASGDFTIDFWANRSAAGEPFGQCTRQSAANSMVFAPVSDLGSVYMGFSDGSTYFVYGASDNDKWNAGTWNHIAYVRNGTTFTLYVNGVNVYQQVGSNSLYNSSLYWTIGAGGIGGSPNYFTGYIDEFRVSKGIARWTSNFTPPTEPYTE